MALLWFSSESFGVDGDHLVGAVPSPHHFALDRDKDYRVTWDREKGLWRLDVRTHVDGG